MLIVSLVIPAQQRWQLDHNARSTLAKFSESKKKGSKKDHHQQLSFEAVNEKKPKKEDSGLPEFGLQRLDEWSIMGMSHGHLW